MRRQLLWTSLYIASLLVLVSGCAPATSTPSSTDPTLQGKLVIFHAGSLTVPVDKLTKAFQASHPGVSFETEAAGSRTTCRKISELGREADIVMSADYTVIDELLIPKFADWNIQFARNAMVIAYTDQSQYAAEINEQNWYDILTREGVVYGHSDPNADPCGYRTLFVWQLAEKYYNVPGLYARLDESCPLENVRPKSVELITLLQSGDMDYAFEYRSVATQHGLKFLELPDQINLSQTEHADFYRQAEVEVSGTEPGSVTTKVGGPIVYGVTIPKNAPSRDLAVAFVRFLVSREGLAIMDELGQAPIEPPVASSRSALPEELKALVQ